MAENQLTGSPDWTLPARGSAISGYAAPASVDVGEELGFAVSTTSRSYRIDIYRIGWYGGHKGRLLTSIGDLPGRDQGAWRPQTAGLSNCGTCRYDTRTGLLEPRWTVGYRLRVPQSWVSGNYLGVLTTPAGDTADVYFVVRNDPASSAILAVMPLATYEAYNNWGGKSLYGTNSVGEPTAAQGQFAGAATEVSLERPFASIGSIRQDFETVAFLERFGYDVSYATSVDLDRDPGLLQRHRIFVSVGHDEYWSREMRDRVEAGRDRGVNLVFLGGNDVYWQARFRSGSDGHSRSVLICYRFADTDPVAHTDPAAATVRFIDPPVLRPQTTLTGTFYTDPILRQPAPWVVAPTAPAWLLAGTALRPGSAIPDLVGVECDEFDAAKPVPFGLVLVSDSPVVKNSGARARCHSTYYQSPGGGQVFSAGTWSWEDFLEGPRTTADVVTMTRNLLTQFGVTAASQAGRQGPRAVGTAAILSGRRGVGPWY